MKVLFCILQAVSILVFGHSYGVDCTEYLPSLAVEAGIETLHIGRFIKGNCSLEEHYDYFVNDTTGKYSECLPGEVSYTTVPKTVRQALSETKWDYVVFQTSLENEGRYLAACTWFESLLTPEYGVSVVGNKFRTEKSPVPVTDDSTALQLQKLARHAARHPSGG